MDLKGFFIQDRIREKGGFANLFSIDSNTAYQGRENDSFAEDTH
jgi:hypothetical protein